MVIMNIVATELPLSLISQVEIGVLGQGYMITSEMHKQRYEILG